MKAGALSKKELAEAGRRKVSRFYVTLCIKCVPDHSNLEQGTWLQSVCWLHLPCSSKSSGARSSRRRLVLQVRP
jgi:hypothetical protein